MMKLISTYLSIVFIFLPTFAFAVEVKAVTTLPRGTVLSSADIHIYTRNDHNRESTLSDYLGMALVRTIYEGHPIQKRDLAQPNLVKRNSIVSMVYQVGALEIRTQGRALDSGVMGDSIRVMNLNSRQTVQSIVINNDVVKVN